MDKKMHPLDPARAGLRASDAEREQVANLLRENYTDGRLTLEELQERLDRAYTATTAGELQTLTTDLPVHIPTSDASPAAPLPAPAGVEWDRRLYRVASYVLLMLFLIGIWAASGMHGSFWPIWPILIGGFVVARDVLGLSHAGIGRHGYRVARHQRRIDRHGRRMDRRFGPPDERD